MSRTFSLVGLLRLRQVQQDIASSEHATANARMRDAALRRARARTDLGEMAVEPQDVAALAAVAAARAAARSTLLELDVLEQAAAEEQERTRVAFSAARVRSIALEKLAERHDAAVDAEDARAEQREIDELTAVAWHRDAIEGTAP